MTRTTHCYIICWLIYSIWLPLSAQSTENSSNTRERYGPVQTNQTLWRIATNLRPPGVSTAQMAIALQQANPHAFTNGDIHQLLAGAVLQIPPLSEIRRLSPAEAAAQLQTQPDSPPLTAPDVAPLDPTLAPTQPSHADQSWLKSWIFWAIGAVCCLMALFSLRIWHKRTREQAYPAAFVASATLTPIPVPVRTRVIPLSEDATLLTEGRPTPKDTLTLAAPDTSVEETIRITGIQVTEHTRPHLDLPSRRTK